MDLFSSNPEPVKVNHRNKESGIIEKTKSSAVIITKTSLNEEMRDDTSLKNGHGEIS